MVDNFAEDSLTILRADRYEIPTAGTVVPFLETSRFDAIFVLE